MIIFIMVLFHYVYNHISYFYNKIQVSRRLQKVVNFNIFPTNHYGYLASSEAVEIPLFISFDLVVSYMYGNTVLVTEKRYC